MSSRIIALPTVLLQSIMRCCDIRDLLALSQSCRTAVQAASSPFPWSLVTARLCTLQPDFVGLLSRSLLWFAPAVDLQWLAAQESTALLLRALSQSLSPDGPLRVLTIVHFRGADPLGSDLTSLLSCLPLLVRLEWELAELVTSPKGMYAYHVPGAMLRVRSRRFNPGPLRTLKIRWIDLKAAGQAFAELDPRIELVEPTPSLSPQEQARAMRERFKASTDK